jgi:hypothetical protein
MPVFRTTMIAIRNLSSFILGAILLASVSGCSGKDGPELYRVTGSITHGGKPIPGGHVIFEPDASLSNKGLGAGAVIKDGHYEMYPGKGIIGGPYIVRVFATDGVPEKTEGDVVNGAGRPLFPPYEFKVDLPKQDSIKDFDVPVKIK